MLVDTAIETEKRCRVCGEYYPLSHFTQRHKGRNDRVTICNACRTDADRQRNTEQRASMIIHGDYSKSYSPVDPCRDLACAVLVQAFRDWKQVSAIHKYSAAKRSGEDQRHKNLLGSQYSSPFDEMTTFFRSAWFETLCDLAGMNPDAIRERIGIT